VRAGAALGKGKPHIGVLHFRVFQKLVHRRLVRLHPDLAEQLTKQAQAIIDRVSAELSTGASHGKEYKDDRDQDDDHRENRIGDDNDD